MAEIMDRSVYRKKVVYEDTDVQEVFDNNRDWASNLARINPKFFPDSAKGQSPKYLWVGCADSRVVPAQITGLLPGDIFVHRNVGNMAKLSDTNCMSSVEYSVGALKVKHIIVCGHYNCGAVQAALKMPLDAPGVANYWISDLRDVRNTHWEHLVGLPPAEQLSRLCEFNVVRQTFNICTSPPVQAAWDKGQELYVHGVIFDIKTGSLKRLVGPVSSQVDKTEVNETEMSVISGTPRHSVRSDAAKPKAEKEINAAPSSSKPKELQKEVKEAKEAESTLMKAAAQLNTEKSQLLQHMSEKEKHIKLLEEQLNFLKTEFDDIRESDTAALLTHVRQLAAKNPSAVTPELAAELAALERLVASGKKSSSAKAPAAASKPAATDSKSSGDIVVPAPRVRKSSAARDIVGGLFKVGMVSAAVLTMKHWDDIPDHLVTAKDAVAGQAGELMTRLKSWKEAQVTKVMSAPSMVAEVAENPEPAAAAVEEKCHLEEADDLGTAPTGSRLFKLAAA